MLNSILCARFEMYIAFFSIFNNFCKDFYSSIHIVVSAHAFEIISEARENQREYWPGFKFLSIILQRVYSAYCCIDSNVLLRIWTSTISTHFLI